jgi:hypothetical protein
MYVEQRMYTAHPGKLPAWINLYGTVGSPVSNQHMGPLIGFFTVEVGPLNRVVFLRGFADIDDREKGMIAREADPAWANFRAEGAKLGALAAQENKMLKTVPFCPIQAPGQPFERKFPGTGLIIDHRTYDFHPGKMNAWLEAYQTMGLPVQQKHLGQFLFMAYGECGPINQVVFMWAYDGLGDREARRAKMLADPGWAEFGRATAQVGPLKQQTTMILKPTSFSPIK